MTFLTPGLLTGKTPPTAESVMAGFKNIPNMGNQIVDHIRAGIMNLVNGHPHFANAMTSFGGSLTPDQSATLAQVHANDLPSFLSAHVVAPTNNMPTVLTPSQSSFVGGLKNYFNIPSL